LTNSSRLAGPLRDLAVGVRRAVEEVEADGVADGPAVEALAPAVHLRRRDALVLGYERGQSAGLVPAGLPERFGQGVVAAELLGERLDLAHGNAERAVRPVGIARHPVAVALRAQAFERRDDP
jgi:hypothetical protein